MTAGGLTKSLLGLEAAPAERKPTLSKRAAQYLLQRKIVAIGESTLFGDRKDSACTWQRLITSCRVHIGKDLQIVGHDLDQGAQRRH